ncbi:MAG: adenylate/guanylate cyclase domain-containing protein [Spirochaetales bacterium]|nr:adenylate/guanylate cyclase domain-containing protein [Spirochaetales bacterium]
MTKNKLQLNKKTLTILAISLIAGCFFLSCEARQQLPNIPKAVNGIIDFTNWDFLKNGNVNLEGQWEFYWQQFLTSEDFSSKKEFIKPYWVHVPGPWKSTENVPEELKTGHGYGTYRLLVKNMPYDQTYAMDVSQLMPYTLFIDGKLIGESGRIGTSEKTSQPEWSRKIYSFRPDSTEMEITIHVSNYHHNLGGLWEHIILGNGQLVIQKKVSGIGFDIFVISALFIMGMYNLIFYLLRKKDKEYLYFPLICLSTIIFILFRGELFCQYILPFITWKWVLVLSFGGPHIFIIALYIFFNACYPEEINKTLLWIAIVVNSLILIIFSIIPAGLFLGNLLPMQSILIIFGLILIIAILRAGLKKRVGAWLFVLSIVFLLFCGLNDIILTTGLQNPFYLMPVGVFIFVISQGFIIALRSTKAFHRNEALTEELAQTNKSYSYFVPVEFLNHLDRGSILDIRLGDQVEEDMGILFCDIRNFTSLSETMTPQENFSFLNSYLKRLGPVVREKNGFIDKYIGDAIMALFPGNIEDALMAGVEIQRVLKKYNSNRKKSNYDAIISGIGIHFGRLMLGVIGEENRMESTAISDSVNLASRIEGLTRLYDVNILVSQSCIDSLKKPEKWTYRTIDFVRVKGKNQKIGMVELLDPQFDDTTSLKIQTLENFNRAFKTYQTGDFKRAAHLFYAIYKKNPKDKCAALLCQRSKIYATKGAPEKWDGAIEYKFK